MSQNFQLMNPDILQQLNKTINNVIIKLYSNIFGEDLGLQIEVLAIINI